VKLPSIRKILREDVKGAPDWVGGIIDPVNSFMEAVYQALNKNITRGENLSGFVKEIVYRTPSTYPSGVELVEFINQLRGRAIGVEVLQAFDRSTYVAAPGPVYVPWVENNGSIVVSTITGLEPSKTYIIRLWIS